MATNEPQASDAMPYPADDLKTINGIKMGIESRLHSAGILTYAQLAALTPEEIMAALGKIVGYTTKRIKEENWTGQAREQAEIASHTKKSTQTEPDERALRQHYATFTMELLLGEENSVRRTKLVHIQSEAEEAWAGWDASRIIEFIIRSAQVPIQKLASENINNKETNLTKQAVTREAVSPPPPVTGTPHIQDLKIISPTTGDQHRILAQGQPFGISMALDMRDVHSITDQPLSYRLVAFAKALGNGNRQLLDSSQGTLAPGDLTKLQLTSDGLPDGTYRIGVEFSANEPTSPAEHLDLAVLMDGGVIKVY